MSSLGKVLIIEDDRVILRSLAETLREAGYDTIAAHNVAGGRQMARFARPDLILLDLGLPDGSGLHVLEVLAEIGSLTPVLVVTGLDPAEVKMPALRSGVQHFLRKPVRKPALLYAVTKLMATSEVGEGSSTRRSNVFNWEDGRTAPPRRL